MAENDKTLQELIVKTATMIDAKDFNQAGLYAKQLLQGYPTHFATYYFDGLIKSHKGLGLEAIESLELAYALSPTDQVIFEKWKQSIQKEGRESFYKIDADIIFVTGGYFFEQTFNGHTPENKALGGSESALVAMAKAMVKLGKKVVVFCNCDTPGSYDGVIYRSNRQYAVCQEINDFKLVIASRFAEYLSADFKNIKKRILWAHDVPNVSLYQNENLAGTLIDSFFCLSQYHAGLWKKHFRLSDNQIWITKNGYDPDFLPAYPKERSNQIVYISRPSRGLKMALDIFEICKSKIPSLKFLVTTYTQKNNIEDDPEFSEYLPFLKRPGIQVLRGLHKKELNQELFSSQLMLYPNTSNAETSCMAAIESMACGCPVVTSSLGALPETVTHNKTGLVVPWDNDPSIMIKKMADSCFEILNDGEIFKSLSEGALLHTHHKHDWNQIAREWVGFLKL